MSLLVPLYAHPAEDPGAWARLTAAASRTQSVVLNPASGPGPRPDPVFTAAAAALRTAGARLLGHFDTAYGAREGAQINYETPRYQEWYGVDGRLLDRVTADRQGPAVGWSARCAGSARPPPS